MAISGCHPCGRTFSSLSAFDAHQAVDYTRRPAVQCMDPATLGMTEADGVWGSPEAHARRAANTARLADSRRPGVAQTAGQD